MFEAGIATIWVLSFVLKIKHFWAARTYRKAGNTQRQTRSLFEGHMFAVYCLMGETMVSMGLFRLLKDIYVQYHNFFGGLQIVCFFVTIPLALRVMALVRRLRKDNF
ncbi:MAG: hypothetical protein V1685_00135 [Parcubacteria group bacterium]